MTIYDSVHIEIGCSTIVVEQKQTRVRKPQITGEHYFFLKIDYHLSYNLLQFLRTPNYFFHVSI